MVHVISAVRPAAAPAPVSNRRPHTDAGSTSSDPGADFRALFTPKASSAVPGTQSPSQPAPTPAPTPESVFGSNPWVTNPTGTGPTGESYGYNPLYFATPQTAAKVAQMVGGTVVESNQFTANGGAFTQQQPNLMVKLPNGHLINPGLVASFYTHGYPQSYVDQMIANEVQNT